MSIASQGTHQKFPFPYDDVFRGLVMVIPAIGFTLKSHDHAIGRISASTGMSLLSYGENLTIIVEKVDEKNTLVGIESTLKVGMNVAGAHRHAGNFNKLIEALSAELQRWEHLKKAKVRTLSADSWPPVDPLMEPSPPSNYSESANVEATPCPYCNIEINTETLTEGINVCHSCKKSFNIKYD